MEILAKSEWTRAKAAHLLNRAGFGGPPAEVERIYELGPEGAVGSLVDYEALSYAVPAPGFAAQGPLPPDPLLRKGSGLTDAERRERRRRRRREEAGRLGALRSWWIQRMLESPRPLEEKLTLFWHGHFATSFVKVRSAYAMYVQNLALRRHAAGSFEHLLVAVSRDPAMLLYLDGARNRKGSPNENYAREVMELFTRGEGRYTEQDIQEAARAFTGWTVNRTRGTAAFRARFHDAGIKCVLGHEGPFGDQDVARILVQNPECARFICRTLWSFFAYDVPEPPVVNALAREFRDGGYTVRPVLTMLFSSREFYAARAVRTQIKSPVQWLISSLKYTESSLPDPGLCHAMLARLGQRLFEPPNVKGWVGGVTWITAATLVDRCNLAGVLARGVEPFRHVGGTQMERQVRRAMSESGPNAPIMSASRESGSMMSEAKMAGEDIPREDPAAAAERIDDRIEQMRRPVIDPQRVLPSGRRTTAKAAWAHLLWRFFQADLPEEDRPSLDHYFAALPDPKEWTDDQTRDVVHMLMSVPHFQLERCSIFRRVVGWAIGAMDCRSRPRGSQCRARTAYCRRGL